MDHNRQNRLKAQLRQNLQRRKLWERQQRQSGEVRDAPADLEEKALRPELD